MEPIQLRDEAVRDRIRLAEEFLDPSKWPSKSQMRGYDADSSRRSKSPKACSPYPIYSRLSLIRDSYRADIILMLNRGLRRLTVSGVCGTFQPLLTGRKVSLDEIRTHNRQLADG